MHINKPLALYLDSTRLILNQRLRVRSALCLEHSVLPLHQYWPPITSLLLCHVVITLLSSGNISHRLPVPLKGFGLRWYTLEKCLARGPQFHLGPAVISVPVLKRLREHGRQLGMAAHLCVSAKRETKIHVIVGTRVCVQRESCAKPDDPHLTSANVNHSADL